MACFFGLVSHLCSHKKTTHWKRPFGVSRFVWTPVPTEDSLTSFKFSPGLATNSTGLSCGSAFQSKEGYGPMTNINIPYMGSMGLVYLPIFRWFFVVFFVVNIPKSSNIYILRKFPTYPWNRPITTPNQQPMFRNSFHVLFWGCLGALLLGDVGILPRYMPIPTYSLDGVFENPRCGVDFLNLKLSEHLRWPTYGNWWL